MTSAVLSVPLEPALSELQGKRIAIGCTESQNDAVSSLHVAAAENPYIIELERALFQKHELILDFSSLKTCLDPLAEPKGSSSDVEDQEFNYQEFIYETFDKKHDKFVSLKNLVLRKIPKETPTPPLIQWDHYTQLFFGVLQLSSLTELDLSENEIHIELQCSLQFWNMENLTKLVMDKTSLKQFPASVGRLRKLEVLSLAKNELTNLPVTLQFCQNLRVLNLQGNQFQRIPAVVLHLKKLDELKRLDNRLVPQHEIYGPKFTRAVGSQNKHNTAQTQTDSPATKHNPYSLQTLCTQTIFSTQVDYWQQVSLGPLQCKVLDRLAGTFTLCENCNKVVKNPGEYAVESLLLSFVGLSGVTFLLNACSQTCQDKIMEEYGEKNIQIQKELDEKYEREKKEAERLVTRNAVDISPEVINAPNHLVQQFVPLWPRGQPYNRNANNRRRRWQKCSLM